MEGEDELQGESEYAPRCDVETWGVTREEIRKLGLTSTLEEEEIYIRRIWSEHKCRIPLPYGVAIAYYGWIIMHGAKEEVLLAGRKGLLGLVKDWAPSREIMIEILSDPRDVADRLLNYMFLTSRPKEPIEDE